MKTNKLVKKTKKGFKFQTSKIKGRTESFQKVALRLIRKTGEVGTAFSYRYIVKIGRKIFERKRLRFHFSLIILSMALFAGSWQPNTLAQTVAADSPKISVLKIYDRVEIETTESLQLPVKNFRISRGFFWFHPGDDLAANAGEPVRPFMAGKVIFAEKSYWGYGFNIVIQHDGTYSTRYAHLSKIFVKTGDIVSKDVIVGEVGSTGFSTGPHLHFEVLEDGKTIDPRQFLEY